jgi:phytoene synthase
MSLQACANLVARADPERFAAAMSAQLQARNVLLPIYAAAAEVSRAPWMTKEPVIAEMRLQWWRDALDEIKEGKCRRHEIVDALAQVLTLKGAEALDKMILARRWDIYKKGFESPEILLEHVRDIALGPLIAALDGLGHLPHDIKAVENLAKQVGLARFLRGVSTLIELKVPVWSNDNKVLIYSDLCKEALSLSSPDITSPALIESANCKRVLRFVLRNPGSVEIGAIPAFPITQAFSRMLAAWRCN